MKEGIGVGRKGGCLSIIVRFCACVLLFGIFGSHKLNRRFAFICFNLAISVCYREIRSCVVYVAFTREWGMDGQI